MNENTSDWVHTFVILKIKMNYHKDLKDHALADPVGAGAPVYNSEAKQWILALF